jgi:hypothetical protein
MILPLDQRGEREDRSTGMRHRSEKSEGQITYCMSSEREYPVAPRGPLSMLLKVSVGLPGGPHPLPGAPEGSAPRPVPFQSHHHEPGSPSRRGACVAEKESWGTTEASRAPSHWALTGSVMGIRSMHG